MPILILQVDDDPNCFRMIEALLQGEGYELHYVRDSATALDEIRRIKPRIVLSDLMMPKVTGIELCQQIKADPATSDIPVILLTALDDEEYLSRCLEAGADDFLSKEVSAPELRARVRSMLRIRAHYDLLRESMRLREDFAHIVMHDLGNPLSTIIMEADELLARSPRADQEPGLEAIRNNARRLRKMTHDMLLLAKIEQGKLSLDSRSHLVSATVAEAVRGVEPLTRRRKLVLRVVQAGEELRADYDEALILRVLDNLLSNAIKFSPPCGDISVRIASGKEGIRVEVEDQGPGIPEVFREKVFERFEIGQVRRDVPQLGLGLSFCRTAVEAHGGTISIGTGSRDGAVVAFTLPARTEVRPAARPESGSRPVSPAVSSG